MGKLVVAVVVVLLALTMGLVTVVAAVGARGPPAPVVGIG